jgi:hypothetical protein
MSIPTILGALLAFALLCPPLPAAAAIRLVPVATGLSSPLFVANAGDNSNRLFIVERAGIVRVLQPGGSTPTVFMDIRAKVLSGGERGLLGLAFHPQYAANGRFFVFYTRPADGTLVIAEYAVSTDPNVAGTAETDLLTIPHPNNSNHNGGMLSFGPDGYLYIGVGDGGSGNDPPNNAQNINTLLGKILRIDINPPAGSGVPYLSPTTNPFYGGTQGRDEIFALGMRNPWRSSFDRVTGQQWVGDVGQGQREEVDTPIVAGGNYGWRVYEGFRCTDIDTALCNPANYLMPVFEYAHTGGRCSLTGGYVYRGTQGAVRDGTYLYADYCTGEIFAWDGATQSVLLDTAMNISSFGEDEQGELYVVDLNGALSRIAAVVACGIRVSPTGEDFAASGGTGSVDVIAAPGCDWTSSSNDAWIHLTSGVAGSGQGSVTYTVDPNPSASPRTGSMAIAYPGQTFTVTQSGLGACTYSVSPPLIRTHRATGTGRVTISAAPGCPWTAQSHVPWLTIASGARGTGNGVVTYRLAPNGGRGRGRRGTMTIAGQDLTVTQAR